MKSECVACCSCLPSLNRILRSMTYVAIYIIVHPFLFAESHYFLWFTKIYLSIHQLVSQKNHSKVCIFAYFGFQVCIFAYFGFLLPLAATVEDVSHLGKTVSFTGFWPLLGHQRMSRGLWIRFPTKRSRVHTTCVGWSRMGISSLVSGSTCTPSFCVSCVWWPSDVPPAASLNNNALKCVGAWAISTVCFVNNLLYAQTCVFM